jgi:hypothetical protein
MWWRDIGLVIVSLVLGPPIAGLVTVAGSAVGQGGLAVLADFNAGLYLATLPFAYFLAWLPMLIVAVCNLVVARLVPEIWRLVLALPIGAMTFLVLLGGLAEHAEGVRNLGETVSIGLAGAVASLICIAVIEAFWPRPQSTF